MLEQYYFSGIPIDLTFKDLGVIHQLTYREMIEKRVTMDNILKPFLMRKEMIKGKSDEFDVILDSVGNLGFVYLMNDNNPDEKILDSLINSLKLFYETEDVYVNPTTKYIHVGSDIVIDIDKFDILSEVVLEMFKITKKEIEDESKMDEMDLEFARKREAYRKKKEKKKVKNKELELVDLVNTIVHSSEVGVDYNRVLDMTIYQIKNTYETLCKKWSHENFIDMKLSQFDTSKMKCSDWRTEKIVKNSAVK